MSKLDIRINYKTACILKHALRDKIKDKENRLFSDNLITMGDMSAEERSVVEKELAEEKRALQTFTEEINECGYMHGTQVFGHEE